MGLPITINSKGGDSSEVGTYIYIVMVRDAEKARALALLVAAGEHARDGAERCAGGRAAFRIS